MDGKKNDDRNFRRTVPWADPWTVRGKTFRWGERTYLMGVLNITPDSFSDGGQFDVLERALVQAERLVDAGADVLDIGGQSTRPGAVEVSLEEELGRVLPVVQAVRSGRCGEILAQIPISIDTTRSPVAQATLAAGADWINDISGGTFDAHMFSTVAQWKAPLILMHLRGTPQTMQQQTDYRDLMGEILGFLQGRIESAIAQGLSRQCLMVDPGIGFAKTPDQNFTILRQLSQLRVLGCPILVGPSRKSFLGHLLNKPSPRDRIWGTAAACCGAIAQGADMIRVHDVAEMQDICRVADVLFRPVAH